MALYSSALTRTRHSSSRKNTAFIIESLLLLVFLIASLAIVLRLFMGSLDLAEKSMSLERAVIAASNTAERFAADPAGLPASFTEGELNVTCNIKSSATGAGTLYDADIIVKSGTDEVYRLHTSKYVSGVRP